jgi:phosphoribosylglycinamide formyltransferase-1
MVPPDNSKRVAVLASGNGSNLQALLDNVHNRDGVEIVRVISDKPGAFALQRAAASDVPTAVFPREDFEDRAARDAAIAEQLRDDDVALVVLAGYMAILSPQFIRDFEGRIVNVHPSLLPKFPGLDAIGQALRAGEAETGVTVHYVDEGVDTGPTIAQESLTIDPDEPLEALTERIHEIEHRLLPSVVARLAQEKVSP